MKIRDKVRAFLERYVGNDNFLDDDNIFEKGLVNSLFAMQLVMFIEKEYGIAMENEDLELDNFKDVTSIVKTIDKKLESN